MNIEIEHKYLVNKELWKNITPFKSEEIRQAYLLSDNKKSIRIRTKGISGYITIKGKSDTIARPEYEYEIPLSDANEMIGKFSESIIEKTRHYVMYADKLWEVDVFKGLNEGLIIAEIELKSEDEKYDLPAWVGEDVTRNHDYSNSNLSKKPYSMW